MISIKEDDSPWILTRKISEVFLQYDQKILSYSFDVTPYLRISPLMDELNQTCRRQPLQKETINSYSHKFKLWKAKISGPLPKKTLFRPLPSLEIIKKETNTVLIQNGRKKCRTLRDISKQVDKFHSDMTNLLTANFSEFHSIIPVNQMKVDIQQAITDKIMTNSSTAFDLSNRVRLE